jgi:acyl carrier protein
LTETEAFLVRVCRQKLDLDTVDRQSDLRRLGADSLFLIELAVEIEDQFDIYVPAEVVEDDARIFRIAQWIEAARVVR